MATKNPHHWHFLYTNMLAYGYRLCSCSKNDERHYDTPTMEQPTNLINIFFTKDRFFNNAEKFEKCKISQEDFTLLQKELEAFIEILHNYLHSDFKKEGYLSGDLEVQKILQEDTILERLKIYDATLEKLLPYYKVTKEEIFQSENLDVLWGHFAVVEDILKRTLHSKLKELIEKGNLIIEE